LLFKGILLSRPTSFSLYSPLLALIITELHLLLAGRRTNIFPAFNGISLSKRQTQAMSGKQLLRISPLELSASQKSSMIAAGRRTKEFALRTLTLMQR